MSRKFKTDWYNQTLATWYRAQIGNFRTQVADEREIGIEIEVEGRRLPREGLVGWDIHEDGSLRGESAEYVFRNAEPRATVPARLQNLTEAFAASNSVIAESYRTSVHVHMNARPMLIKQIYSNIMLYVMFEDVLAEIAGRDRIGNLFCLRAKDAGFFLDQLRQAVVLDNIGHITAENLRYSAVNPNSLARHGSLEFRSFRGTTDMVLIQQWVDLLCKLKDAAVTYDNPMAICQDFSSKGPVGFAQGILTEDQLARFERGWEDKLVEGVQVIQHAAYGHDWAPSPKEEDKVKIKRKRSEPKLYNNYAILDEVQAAPQPRDQLAVDFEAQMARIRQLERDEGRARWVVAPPPLPEPDWNQNANRDEDL